MGRYKEAEIKFSSQIKCSFSIYEEDYNDVLIANFIGKVGFGSSGGPDADYMYQKLGEYVLYFHPFCILIDFRDLEYEYGNSILKVFDVVQDINFADSANLIPIALLVSDKCIYGLSSLIGFNPEKLPDWIFTDYDKALEYAVIQAKIYGDL